MKTSTTFTIFGFILLFGFAGIMAIICLPMFPKNANELPALFTAVVFGLTGGGLIYIARKEHLTGR